jgi:hypothetical protein
MSSVWLRWPLLQCQLPALLLQLPAALAAVSGWLHRMLPACLQSKSKPGIIPWSKQNALCMNTQVSKQQSMYMQC